MAGNPPHMLQPDIARSVDDLKQILALQRQNLKQFVSEAERNSQGFVTLEHDLATLQQMNELAPHVVIRDQDRIVAYALSQLKESREIQADLAPLFIMLDSLEWNGRPLHSIDYYVMGQVCIGEAYRGKGLFEQLYTHHKEVYQSRFELFITEISTSNPRSLRAHEKLGFRPLHTYRDHLDEWSVVGWDWN